MVDNPQEQVPKLSEVKGGFSSSPPPSDTPSLIDRADAVAKRMEEANKKAEELLTRQEAIAARMLLSGRADAGHIEKTPEQNQKEEADKQAQEIIKRFRH